MYSTGKVVIWSNTTIQHQNAVRRQQLCHTHRLGNGCRNRKFSASLGSLLSLVVIILGNGILCHNCYGVHALTVAQRRTILLSRIRKGMALSQDAQHNITAAEEACDVFEKEFSKSIPSSLIAPEIISLSKSLYASCLVRVGKDADALSIYNSCLDEIHNKTDVNGQVTNWRLSKAKCLQRLLQYSAAAEEYSRVVQSLDENKSDKNKEKGQQQQLHQARMGAANCILRSTWDLPLAQKLLSWKGPLETPSDALMMSHCLDYLQTGNADQTVNRLLAIFTRLLQSSENHETLVFQWILAALQQMSDSEPPLDNPEPMTTKLPDRATENVEPSKLFLELIRINTSPWDDPGLLRLDDKIELHRLLLSTSSSISYWPEGFILPDQVSEWKGEDSTSSLDDELWISKSRAGYGSHGNQILTYAEANEQAMDSKIECSTRQPSFEDSYLLQRMVDPLLLLNGHKFSLRIYVVYFSAKEAYISTKGLVKLASTRLGENPFPRDASMHMTNSGRETVMRQEDLTYLWKEVDRATADASESSTVPSKALWKKICDVAADTLLVRYPNGLAKDTTKNNGGEKQVWTHRREALGIPKILGLDFVVDARLNPWLVEVNRFPGLEPRDEDDRKIKYKVVKDAWKKAFERLFESAACNDENNRGIRIFFDDCLLDCLSEGEDTAMLLERL